jgi:hypothetical protein
MRIIAWTSIEHFFERVPKRRMLRSMAKRKAINRTAQTVDTTRASRGGHTFHERWAARRAMQLVFPQDRLRAIAVEGLSTSETAKPGTTAEEVADLVLYFGEGDNFETSDVVQTAQFKYKTTPGAVTASYLRKTVEKFGLHPVPKTLS